MDTPTPDLTEQEQDLLIDAAQELAGMVEKDPIANLHFITCFECWLGYLQQGWLDDAYNYYANSPWSAEDADTADRCFRACRRVYNLVYKLYTESQ